MGYLAGVDKFGEHIFANPLEPHLCPILSLALLMFCSGNKGPNGKQQVYCGINSKDRFGHLLKTVLETLDSPDAKLLGCLRNDVGCHSTRKGGASHCLGPAGPVLCF